MLEKCPTMEFSPVHIFSYLPYGPEKNYVFVRFSHSDIYVIYKYIYVIYLHMLYQYINTSRTL